MINENNLDEDVELPEDAAKTRTSTSGERAAVAERVALHRARKAKAEERELVLSEKQKDKIQAATSATFAKVYSRLTAEQKLALETSTDELSNLQDLNAMMFEATALSDLEMFSEDMCRPDIVAELRSDYVAKHPYAKDLIIPRAWYADRDYKNDFPWYVAAHVFSIKSEKQANGTQRILIEFDPDAPVQFSLDQFFSAVKKYKKWKEQTPGTSAILEEEPVKRGRGRPRKVAAETKPAGDPTKASKWSQPPPVPRKDFWGGVSASNAARSIEEQQTEA